MILAISYDLNTPGKKYDELYDTIKTAPGYIWAMDSLWFISTNETVETWSNRLQQVLDKNDYLFVVNITGQPMYGWMRKDVWDWLQQHDQIKSYAY